MKSMGSGWENLKIQLALKGLKVKDLILNGLCSCVVYIFSIASCHACYIGETTRHFSTRVKEHLKTDKASYIYKHLHSSNSCLSNCSKDCFKIIDLALTSYDLTSKEALHILWEKPTLNIQVKPFNIKLSF